MSRSFQLELKNSTAWPSSVRVIGGSFHFSSPSIEVDRRRCCRCCCSYYVAFTVYILKLVIMSSSNHMLEGLGGPIQIDQQNFGEIDPTLAACCRREVESNRKRSVLEQTLSRHDVIAQKERHKRHLISNLSWGAGCRCCYDPNSDGGEYRALIELRQREAEAEQEEEEEEEHQQDQDSEDVDSDDEFDYLLDEDLPGGNAIQELEERRRAELEFAMLQQEVAIQHGYGVHRQMHPNRVLRAAGLGGTNPSPAVVLHLVDPDSMASASLDLCLEKLAETFRGTKFLRSGGRSVLLMDAEMAQKSMPRLSPDSDMPALVAIREGVVIAVCPRLQGLLSDDSDEAIVIPDEVRAWLDKAGVLLERPPPIEEVCLIRPEEEALMDHLAASAKNAAPRYDCGMPMCNKTFPHEHVGIQNKQQDGLVVQEEEVLGAKET